MKPHPIRRAGPTTSFCLRLYVGFHGCDQSVGEAILSGVVEHLSPSLNDYDWLGSGIYLWEGNAQRVYQFAVERAQGGRNSRGSITKPFILGVTLNLKRCLNLADSSAIAQLRDTYHDLVELSRLT